MKRKLPDFTRIVVRAKYPERPLNEAQQYAVARGEIQCQFLTREKTFWCGRRRQLTGPEFSRVWAEAGAWCDRESKDHPGFIGIPEQDYQDTPFLTGRVI